MNPKYYIEYPDIQGALALNEEWIIVKSGNTAEKIRLHDYNRIYQLPGLYEEVICRHLKYASPRVLCALLKKELRKVGKTGKGLRVFDFGAGNGLSGEFFVRKIGCDIIVGVDIIKAATEAIKRDRPEIYDQYYVMDFTSLDHSNELKIKALKLNTLIAVGALGFDDIPAKAFVEAFNLLPPHAWVAFNIKDTYLSEEEGSGFKSLLDSMFGDSLLVLQKKRYRHRFSVTGVPLYYYGIIGRKAKEITPF